MAIPGVLIFAGLAIAALEFQQRTHLAALADSRDALRVAARPTAAATRATSHVDEATTATDAGPAAPGERLRRLAAALPPDLWLVAYEERDGTVAMRGFARREKATQEFLHQLPSVGFRQVELSEAFRVDRTPGSQGSHARLQEFRLKAETGEPAPGSIAPPAEH
jgi:hypothetical protein